MHLSPQSLVFQTDKFRFHVMGEKIILLGEENESIELVPAEGAILCNLLGSIGGIRSFKVLPPSISDAPFNVHFTSGDGNCVLTRHTNTTGLTFHIDDYDELVRGVQATVQKVQDINIIRGGPSAGSPAFEYPDPIIEGR